jgi:hypothetical protein
METITSKKQPKKLATIKCGCSDDCGGTITIYANHIHDVYAITPHGTEEIETYYDNTTWADLRNELTNEYADSSWELELFF